jgi:hypothetical protein
MQTWEELRVDLIAFGFVELVVLELNCPCSGDWRLGILTDSEFRPRCPKCNQPCDAAVLGRELCRCRIFEPRCVSPALPENWKTWQEPAVILHTAARSGRRRNPGFLRRMQRELAALQSSVRS